MAVDDDFKRTRDVLADALSRRAFPCVVAEVGRTSGPLWTHAAGRLIFEEAAAPATPDTIFDLASLTKVLATAAIALRLLHHKKLSLEAAVGSLVSQWVMKDARAHVTIRDLLEHSSGLPAHRKYYEIIGRVDRPTARRAYQAAICAEPLAYPPRTQSIYSDPGFMLLGFILEDLGHGPLAVQFDAWRDRAGVTGPLRFNPPTAWRDGIAPTEQDEWRGRLIIGEVHDENAAALGGVAAHAGLFGSASAVGACARWWLGLLTRATVAHADATADEAELFATRSIVPASSRALAWDTMLPTSSCGTCLSPRAIGHTGFTGTSLWLDPAKDLYAVLLTNRVHPSRANDGIQPVRRAFHDAVMADLEERS